MPIKVKIYGIFAKGEQIPAICVQVKCIRTARNCIVEYMAIGRLSADKEYEVRKLAA